jgi:hypothetical protein
MDELGNRMNADGEQDSSVVAQVTWDTVENIKMNNAVVKAEKKYLDANEILHQ